MSMRDLKPNLLAKISNKAVITIKNISRSQPMVITLKKVKVKFKASAHALMKDGPSRPRFRIGLLLGPSL